MFTPDQYQLLDFGEGRRLERFGPVTLDRPCPAVEQVRARPIRRLGRQADARFDGRRGDEGDWTCRRELPEPWTIAHGRLQFELKRTVFGHVGLFPEQAENWDWIGEQVAAAARPAVACSTCLPTPAAARWRRPRPGRRSSTSMRPRTSSPGPAATPSFRPGRRADPLDRRGRPEIRQARTPPRQPLRRRDPRSAQLRARPARRGLAAGKAPAAAAGTLRRVDGRPAAVHAADVPHARLRRRPGCGGCCPRPWATPTRARSTARPLTIRGHRPGVALRRCGAMEERVKRCQRDHSSPACTTRA